MCRLLELFTEWDPMPNKRSTPRWLRGAVNMKPKALHTGGRQTAEAADKRGSSLSTNTRMVKKEGARIYLGRASCAIDPRPVVVGLLPLHSAAGGTRIYISIDQFRTSDGSHHPLRRRLHRGRGARV